MALAIRNFPRCSDCFEDITEDCPGTFFDRTGEWVCEACCEPEDVIDPVAEFGTYRAMNGAVVG